MLNLYSVDLTSAAAQIVEWGVKSIQRGTSATLSQDKKTIYLNTPGVYEISVNGYGSTTAAGTFGFQLVGDGEDIVRGAASMSTAIGGTGNAAFTALVAVNSAIGTNKAAISVEYTGGAGTIDLANIVVKKVA